jgi:CHASE2 domain-containing sensor protein
MSSAGNVRASSWRQVLKPSLLEFVFALWCAYLIIFDPLSVDTFADRAASLFYNTVFSPFYARGASSDDGQSAIVVLVYDDAYLQAAGTQWGFSPNDYKPLFTRIAQAKARAVFFDIQFLRGDGSRDAAIASLYMYTNDLERLHGTKFVFASVLADPMPKFENVSANRYALAEMRTSEEAYALYQAPTSDPYYALPTAALSLYRIWCERGCETRASLGELDSSLFVEWGFAPDQKMRNHSAGGEEAISCQQTTQNAPHAWLQSFQVLFRVAFGQSEAAPCMYHRNFSVYFINSASAGPELAQLLTDKIVLVGTNLAANSDYTFSPVHGSVPGVFRHAMALDNLIERGDNYVRWVDDPASQGFELLVLVVMLAGLLWFKNVAVPHTVNGPSADALRVLYWAASGLFLWLVVLATIALFRWGANNWVSYALMFALAGDVAVPAIGRLAWGRMGHDWRTRIRIGLLVLLALVGSFFLVASAFIFTVVDAHNSWYAYLLESLGIAAVLVALAVLMLRRIDLPN